MGRETDRPCGLTLRWRCAVCPPVQISFIIQYLLHMKSPEELVSELSFSDPSTHWFAECRRVNKPLDNKVLGVYGQRLDACDSKIRFAAKSYLAIRKIVSELEHGEFIYFDDASRLDMSFNAESLLIFLRASLDLVISTYYAYFGAKTNIDSFNDFVKQVGKRQQAQAESGWLPTNSREFWSGVYEDYISDDFYTWIHALVGKDKGMSLRDLVIHKQSVIVDTYIDANDRGRFFIGLTKDSMGHIMPWLEHIFEWVQTIMDRVKSDIVDAEKSYR